MHSSIYLNEAGKEVIKELNEFEGICTCIPPAYWNMMLPRILSPQFM